MKNANYNLVKLLHEALDNAWRIEKHYLGDAGGAGCACPGVLKQLHQDYQKHIEMLKAELAEHQKTDNLA